MQNIEYLCLKYLQGASVKNMVVSVFVVKVLIGKNMVVSVFVVKVLIVTDFLVEFLDFFIKKRRKKHTNRMRRVVTHKIPVFLFC